MKIFQINSVRRLIIISLIFSSIILCFMGFKNGYPLVYPDTGTYIRSGFKGFVPEDRPLLYGLFIRHVSLAESLWLVIFFQALILSLTVFYYFYYLTNTSIRNKIVLFLAYILLITFYFGASVNASQLIPDIFTPVTILCVGLLIFADKLKRRDKIIISTLLIFSLGVHNSHFLIVTLILISYFLIFLYKKLKKSSGFFYERIRKLYYISLLIVISFLFNSFLNLGYGSNFGIFRGGHVFLMSRLNDMGILKEYLDENCNEKAYKICKYRDNIPWDFLWDANSPVYLTGGWSKNKKEYNEIISDILTTPKYLKIFLIRTFESSIKQFFSFDTGDTPVQTMGSAPFGAIDEFFHKTTKEYLSSKQSYNTLNYRFINQSQIIIFSLILFLFCVIFLSKKIEFKWKVLILFFLGSLYFNATVSTLSSVADRFQSRVIWLLPLPLFIIFSDKEIIKKLMAGFRKINKLIH